MRLSVDGTVDFDDSDVKGELDEDALSDVVHDAIKEAVTSELDIPAGWVTVNVRVSAE